MVSLAYYFSSREDGLNKMHAVSCANVEERARRFAKQQLPDIVKAARSDAPDAGPTHLVMAGEVGMLKKELAECRKKMYVNALGTDISLYTHLKDLYDLYSLLEPFMLLWREMPPSKISRSEEMLNRIEHLQGQLSG